MIAQVYNLVLEKLMFDNSFLFFCENMMTIKELNDHSVFIWGTGEVGNRALRFLDFIRISVEGYICTNPQSDYVHGIKLYAPDILREVNSAVVFVASMNYEDEILVVAQKLVLGKCIKLYSFNEYISEIIRRYFADSLEGEVFVKELFDTQLFFYGKGKSFGDNIESVFREDNLPIGYETDTIFSKVKSSTEKVLRGEAAFERDGVVFNKPEYNYQFLSAYYIALSELAHLDVLDFGGSLGSIYFEHRDLIINTKPVWNIIEQQHFVEYGKKRIQEINFFQSVNELLDNKVNVNFVILSAVIGYLDNPYSYLKKIVSLNARYIFIDRTAFIKGQSYVVKQNVPQSIYRAVYCVWLLQEEEFLRFMESQGYRIKMQWKSFDDIRNIEGQNPEFKGYLFQK